MSTVVTIGRTTMVKKHIVYYNHRKDSEDYALPYLLNVQMRGKNWVKCRYATLDELKVDLRKLNRIFKEWRQE